MTLPKYDFSLYVERFFVERLVNEMGSSVHTVSSYRDTFRLLISFINATLKTTSTELNVRDVDARLIGNFLTNLENDRGNCARTRNQRLAAIKAFFKYVAIYEPQLLNHCRRILDIKQKKVKKKALSFLKNEEITDLINAPDLSTWYGRRDRTIFLLYLQTGMRLSELTGLKNEDIEFGPTSLVTFTAKGDVERKLPLRKDIVQALKNWMIEREGKPEDFLFISNRGGKMSHDAIQQRVRVHMHTAKNRNSYMKKHHITPHSLRHTTAMEILQHGGQKNAVKLWLGHASLKSTADYIHADIEMKERTMALTQEQEIPTGTDNRYRPSDKTLKFLDNI